MRTSQRGRGVPWTLAATAALALLVGVFSFALSAVAITVVAPHVPAAVVAVVDIVVILAVAHFWGIAYAVPVGVATMVALDWYAIPPTHPSLVPSAGDATALAGYLLAGVLLGALAAHARERAEVAETARSAIADEQAALRRVATLVAREPLPAELFAMVAEEVGRLLRTDIAGMLRYETDGTATVVAGRSEPGVDIPVGARLAMEGDSVTATVLRTGRPARFDSVATATGALAEFLRKLGVRSAAGCPIVVEGRVWGVMVAASVRPDPLPEGTESRIGEFTELVATAISNAEARAELTASRARIVTAGDETRRRLERDLHDGVQQRLVSLALEVRLAETIAPPEPGELRVQLSRITEGLTGALDDLREISQGIHPATLSNHGLRPALKALARRSAVPVELSVRVDGRLPEQVEVAVYYVMSEALTNAAKHAQASVVQVEVECGDATVSLSVRDDGVGGAELGRGSGLVGLRDRVEALGGRIEIRSPAATGTSLVATLPVPAGQPAGGAGPG